ncbi:MAG: ammonium transporter [Pelagibacteraceae bacterium]|jgi:Amt family ammonium transporter|nr:ammonium transporter [bacterium]GIR16994.1 MAG: ammonium transporter [Pelagibacteraceae bacterium]|tara:strand:- start:69 stop:1349 length:1281 start_codon:yes stop_codon:yes gene_type:complete
MKKILTFLIPTLLFSGVASAEVSAETAFVFNTFLFVFSGVLVMFMALGFAMLEAGFVRKKNTSAILLKNIALYSIAGIMFYLIGYSLMYVDVSGWIGSLGGMFYDTADDLTAATEEGGYSLASDWFFQMVFCATAISIVSGACAERIKVWPFMIFAAFMTGIIYPIYGSWTWGGGWLTEMGFSDFAGSTIVHSVGGWAALTGCLILGPRAGKYGADGKISPIAGANMPLACLGTFILWFGWFGFNGGSQLALGSAADASAMSIVVVNTNIAACGGVVAAIILSQLLYKKIDLSIALNGAIAGLVAITAGPDLSNHFLSMIVGAIGGILCTIAIPMLDKMKIDDVVGAISAHLVAGIWGTLAVGIFGSGDFLVQLIGIVAAAVLVVPLSGVFFYILKGTVGLRVSEETEASGLDSAELTTVAYPEFK